MPPTAPWRPMSTAPETVARIWLNHLTLGPIRAEGRRGRWYAPSAAQQVWRWYRPAGADTLEPFTGWLPFEAAPALDEAVVTPLPRIRPESVRTGGACAPRRADAVSGFAPLP